MESFFSTSLEARLALLLTESPAQAALNLFHSAAAVPAYRDFLKREGVDLARIQTEADFQKLPLLIKQNYILAYPLPQRCSEGRLRDCEMIAVSSGATGKPLFWPRSLEHEFDTAFRFEQIFRDSFQADRRPTLVQYDPLSRFFEVTPEGTLKPMGDPKSFPVGVKHRYTRK